MMCLTGCSDLVATATTLPQAGILTPAADHHLHIQSPQVTAELRRVAERLPAMFAGLNPAILDSRSGADALRVLDDAGVAQGVLLSEAYMYASVFATAGLANPARLTREENMFNVEAAEHSGGRLKAFIGVNPFCDFALDEIRYWGERGGAAGIKLHLANSGFEPDLEEHIGRLASVFREANRLGFALLVHLRPAGTYNEGHIDRIIEDVLSQAPDVVIQLAHAGGGGGLDDPTLLALERFCGAIAEQRPGTRGLLFDLAAVLVRDVGDSANVERLARFVAVARSIGLDRFLIGSDWPTLCSPLEHTALLLSQMPFDDDEWLVLARNRADYLD